MMYGREDVEEGGGGGDDSRLIEGRIEVETEREPWPARRFVLLILRASSEFAGMVTSLDSSIMTLNMSVLFRFLIVRGRAGPALKDEGLGRVLVSGSEVDC